MNQSRHEMFWMEIAWLQIISLEYNRVKWNRIQVYETNIKHSKLFFLKTTSFGLTMQCDLQWRIRSIKLIWNCTLKIIFIPPKWRKTGLHISCYPKSALKFVRKLPDNRLSAFKNNWAKYNQLQVYQIYIQNSKQYFILIHWKLCKKLSSGILALLHILNKGQWPKLVDKCRGEKAVSQTTVSVLEHKLKKRYILKQNSRTCTFFLLLIWELYEPQQ